MSALSKPLRCIVGARVSTDTQAREGISLTNQLDVGRAKVEEIGGVIVGYCLEEGVSGARYESRDVLQESIKKIEAGEADALVCYDLSRLSRDTESLLQIERRVARAGGQIIYCNMRYSANATGKLQKTLLAAIGNHERERLIEVSHENRIKRVRSGIQTQRSLSPYGYRVVNRNDVIRGDFPESELGKYKIVEEEAEVVRFIFERYAAGDSLRSIGFSLDKKEIGMPKPQLVETAKNGFPKRKKAWGPSSLKSILENPCHYGQAAYGRHKRAYDDARISQGFKTDYKLVKVPEEEWLTISCPAIVSKDLFDLCNDKLKANKSKGGRKDRKHALTGLLRCPYCQHSLSGFRHAKATPDREWHYYRCDYAERAILQSGLCLMKRMKALVVENLVYQAVETIASQPQLIEKAFAEHRRDNMASKAESELKRAQGQLAKCERDTQVAIGAQLEARSNGIDPSIYENKLRSLSSEAARIRDTIAQARSSIEGMEKGQPQDFQQWAHSLQESVGVALRSADVPPNAKNEMLARIIERVYPLPSGEIEVHFQPMVFSPKSRLIWKSENGGKLLLEFAS